jgi:hypothetical protein
MAPCRRCGVVPELHTEEDVCYMCGGLGHDDIGNDCIGCVRGVRTTDQWLCDCDRYGYDEDDEP